MMRFLPRPYRFIYLLFTLAAYPVWAADTLVPTGSTWKYLDDGSDQDTAWTAPAFNDSGWSSGPAQLGYGDGDEATVVSGGPVNDRFPTTYYRLSFNVANASLYTGLTLNVLRDDGVAVYLNGTEIFRNNIIPGANYFSHALQGISGADETTYLTSAVAANTLQTGNNVLAVEIHQSSPTSSDTSFDMELIGNLLSDPPQVIRGPYLQQVGPGSAIVRWRTHVPSDSRVNFGTDYNNLTSHVQSGTSTTEHEVTLTGLTAQTQYYYSIGTTTTELMKSTTQFFKSAPTPGTRVPTRMWIIGDAGWNSTGQHDVYNAYLNYTGNQYTDLWLMLGDNAYVFGTDNEYQTGLFNVYPELLKQTGVWSTLGNHDSYSTDPNTLNHSYYDIFSFPTAGQHGGVASGTEAYYSFNHANIHFVVLDSQETDHAPGSAMLTWLVSDLQANTADWSIVLWHHPPYSKGSHDSDYENSMIEMRENVVPILDSYGVDLMLSGHSHSYERSKFVKGHYGLSTTFNTASHAINSNSGDPARGAAPYQKAFPTVANSGAVYAVVGSSGTISGGSLDHPVMFSSLNELGSMVIDVTNITLTAKFLDDQGVARDAFTLQKLATGPDTDLDGFMNVIDNCPELANSDQADFDNDLLGDLCDFDDDNDGVPDSLDLFPLNPLESSDLDADTIGDNGDNCGTLSNTTQTDANSNGLGDICETGTQPLNSIYRGSQIKDSNTVP